jgi:hypothetical protein
LGAEGRRCAERRFLTLEHIHPFALGGPPTSGGTSAHWQTYRSPKPPRYDQRSARGGLRRATMTGVAGWECYRRAGSSWRRIG